jgi:E3 ubiquitin-protein ligase RNF14
MPWYQVQRFNSTKRFLTEAEYERRDRLLLQKTLDSMSNVVYCPNCVIGCMEDDDNNAQCPKCSFIFCSFCKGPCHPGKKCLTPEEKIQLRKVCVYIYIYIYWFVVCSLFSAPECHSMLWFYWKCTGFRQDDWEGGGAGTVQHQTTVQGCSAVPEMCGQFFCFACGKAISGYQHFR